jgi:hypothetical protein
MARAGQNRRIGELVDVKAAGDKVAVIIRPRASKGPAPGLVANLTTVRDGKAVEMVHYASADDALAALSSSY